MLLLIGLFWPPAAIGAASLDRSRCAGWLRCVMSVDSVCTSPIARPAGVVPVVDPLREEVRFRFRLGLRVWLLTVGSRIHGRSRYCRMAFPAGRSQYFLRRISGALLCIEKDRPSSGALQLQH